MFSFPGRWVLPFLGLLALGIAWTEYRTLRTLDLARPGAALQELRSVQPWGGFTGAALAGSLQHTWRLDPASAEAAFAWHLERQPLDAYRWLNRASTAQARRVEAGNVQQHVEAAVSAHPRSWEINWRAATIAIQVGQTGYAEAYLRHWLEGQPQRVDRALFTAARWIDDPQELIERVLPDGEDYFVAALAFARRAGRMDLAEAAWSRLSGLGAGDRALFDFVELALDKGDHGLAIAVWQSRFPEFEAGQVPNGDFRHPLGAGRGLDWDTRVPAGAAVTRDQQRFVTEPASLRIDFDGTENIQLSRPSVRIPVDPEITRWEISGHWRAQGLTTRGLPYLAARAQGGRWAREDVPGTTFNWTPFRIEIENPDGAKMLEINVSRDRPGVDFDRNLSGQLWLDALRLTPLSPKLRQPATRTRRRKARHAENRAQAQKAPHPGNRAQPQEARHPGNRAAVIRDPHEARRDRRASNRESPAHGSA